MRRIPVESLAPEAALPRPLFHESGALLFAAGDRVGEEEIALLRRSGIRRVYDVGGEPETGDGIAAGGAMSEPAISPQDVRIFRRERRTGAALRAIERAAGARLPEDRLILDPRGELRDAGVDRVLDRARAGDRPEGAPWSSTLAGLRPEAPRAAHEKAAAMECRALIMERLAALFSRLRDGGAGPELGFVQELVRDLCVLAAGDPDLAVAMALLPEPEDTGAEPLARALGRHSFDAAAIAMATAIELGYSLAQLVEVGAAALLHDVGMVRLPSGLVQKPGALDVEERRELERHPVHALEVLRRFQELPVAVAAAALEEHEALDGSGYPKGTADMGEFARIIHAADVFEALASPRPHRPAIRPHDAVREAVARAARKKLDTRVVRALLKTVALFPLGSFVRLSDGALARVVRPGGPDASRPLVVVFTGTGRPLLDLSARPEIRIAEADVPPPADEDPLAGF